MNNGQTQAYQANQVSTVNGSKLILMMYDGAIRFINEAILKTDAKDVAGRGLYISKAQKIINELENALDKNRGGQVAVNLGKAYQEMSRKLIEANISGEASDLRVTLQMVSILKGAWEKVINGAGSTSLSNSGSLRNEMNLSKTAANVVVNA